MVHLRYCLQSAFDEGIKDHAVSQMKKLGITYTHSTPQSIGDQWWFWNCEDIPDTMPDYLSILDIQNAHSYVGFGLSEHEAYQIEKFKKMREEGFIK